MARIEPIQTGRRRGERLSRAIRHNLRGFLRAADRRGIELQEVHRAASRYAHRLPATTRAEIKGMAEGAGVPYCELLAFNLLEDALMPDGCTVAIAAGAAAAKGETVFFKQSDKKGANEFQGEDYHAHQQINIIRIEHPPDGNNVVSVTAAGSTATKMGMNDQGVAIGSNISRTHTFDEMGSDSRDWAAASRGEYMRQGLLHGDTADEVAQHILPMLYSDPMSSPGNIDIADPERAIIIEGEFTHLASEWVEDGVIGRANKFEVLSHLARPKSEIPSSYARYERVMDVLQENAGKVTVQTMLGLSVDHKNGPGLQSVCRHQEGDHTDETTLSSAIFDLRSDRPDRSAIYIALGKACHAWRTDAGDGWVKLTADATEADVPNRFLTGEAWLEHYTEEPYAGDREVATVEA